MRRSATSENLAVVAQGFGQCVKVRERLERGSALGEVAREPGRGEYPVGGKRGAAIGVAVANVDDLAGRQQRPLARLAARIAVVRVAPVDPPAVRPRLDPVRVEGDV